MNWQNVWQLAKSDYVKLVPILALAFYIAFIPNLGYPYPVHIDEWVHMAQANEIFAQGNINISSPFSGEAMLLEYKMEIGFQLLLGIFKHISGLSWPTVFRYLPSIIFMFTVLMVYIAFRRKDFGWEAALLTCLITTNVGILGPAFLVPVALALLFLPLSLYLAMNYRTLWSYLVIFILNCFVIVIHGPSAICIILILIPYILLNMKDEPRHSLGIALALFLPFIVTLPWTYEPVGEYAQAIFTPQPPSEVRDLPRLFSHYGALPIVICLIGLFGLSLRGGKDNYSLVLGLLVIVAMLAIFYTTNYGILIVYLRGLLFGMLMIGIIGGAGLRELKTLKLLERLRERKPFDLIIHYAGWLICLTMIILTLVTAIPARQNTPYYHMIDETDYEAFVWIRDNVDDSHRVAILDPWKATAFTAITEKYVYTRIHMGPNAKTDQAATFITNNCTDTTFLKENGISIIYTRGKCSNPDLTEVKRYVYLLEETGTQ
jgi:hypothetical protein